MGARFALDAMPGKQMSIDADVRAGTISAAQAQDRRRALEQECQLHGAMDGAMKFVKGDAIAGVVIALVNILAGICIGTLMRDMSIGDALQRYRHPDHRRRHGVADPVAACLHRRRRGDHAGFIR